MNKQAIVNIKGGFGNQLFQYSFANFLQNNNFEVKVNCEFFDNEKNFTLFNNTKRELILNPNFFGFEEVGNKELDVIQKKLSTNRKIKAFDVFSISYFKGHQWEVGTSSKLNLFDGYWHNLKYVEHSKNFLDKKLMNIDYYKNCRSYGPKKGSTMIHVRRSDYLTLGWELNSDYFDKCIKYLRNNVENFHYDIFTDDKNWVQKNQIFKDAKNIFGKGDDTKLNTLKTFSNMLRYENSIIGASSLSFFSAFLSEKINSLILYPDPWFRNSDHPDISKEKWIKIENE